MPSDYDLRPEHPGQNAESGVDNDSSGQLPEVSRASEGTSGTTAPSEGAPRDARKSDLPLVDLPLAGSPGAPSASPSQAPETGERATLTPPPTVPPVGRNVGGRRKEGRLGKVVTLLLLLLVAGCMAYFAWGRANGEVQVGAELDFGTGAVGDVLRLPLQVAEVGKGKVKELTFSLVAEAKSGTQAFQLDATGCSAGKLAKREACEVQLTFLAPGPGMHRAEVTVDSTAGQQVVQVQGRATDLNFGSDRPTVRFPSVRLEESSRLQTLIVNNEASQAELITEVVLEGDSGDFLIERDGCSGTSLEQGQSCRLELRFTPQDEAEREATVRVKVDRAASDGLSRLVGVGIAPAVVRFPAGRPDFGEVKVGSRTVPREVKIENRTNETIEVLSLKLEGTGFSLDDRSCAGSELQAGEACSVQVSFDAVDDSPSESVLVVETSSGEPARLRLTAQAVRARLVFSPESFSFGAIRLGSSGSASVEVRNLGTAAGDLAELSLSSERGLSVVEDACSGATLEPQQDCVVTLSWKPQREGQIATVVSLGTGEQQISAPVSGQAVVGRLVLETDQIGFGKTPFGTTSRRSVVVSNGGSQVLRVLGVTTTGDGRFEVDARSCAGELAPGATCPLGVRFVASAQGTASGSVQIEHDGQGAGVVGLTAEALPKPLPRLESQPGRFDFGPMAPAERSGIETLRIRNVGAAPLELKGLSVEGRDAGAFRMVPGSCALSVALVPGGECTVGIRSTGNGSGVQTAELVVMHNGPARRMAIPLRVEILSPGVQR